jgi:hypothetical protein
MTIRIHFDIHETPMNIKKLQSLLLPVLLVLPTLSLAAEPVRFQCHFRDINTQTDQAESLDFVRDVTACDGTTGGICFVPIDHLKTKIECRDFTASFDENSEPRTLDVTLWSYCGNAPDPARATSQTVSLPPEAKHFQLTAEWGRFLTIVKCSRL